MQLPRYLKVRDALRMNVRVGTKVTDIQPNTAGHHLQEEAKI